jgi:ferredoxin-NADP reductase
MEAVVSELILESDSVYSLKLVPTGAERFPDWSPGAHLDLRLPPGTTRQYSIIESGPDCSWFRVAVLRDPNSRGGSEYVHLFLRPGQRVMIGGPRNHFPLEPASSYLFIAGGIGITPILPMVAYARSRGIAHTLHYGGRTRSSMAYVGRVESWGSSSVLWPEDSVGRIPLREIMERDELRSAVYTCGPEPLIKSVVDTAAAVGYAESDVHVERFKPRVKPQTPNRPVTVSAQRSGVTVEVDASTSILDGLLRAGVSVNASCRSGVCGTCEVGVRGGIPDHRDDVLTADQQSRGDSMLVCVSRAFSDELVLDV